MNRKINVDGLLKRKTSPKNNKKQKNNIFNIFVLSLNSDLWINGEKIKLTQRVNK